MALGIVIVAALPGVARRVGIRLAQDDGLTAAGNETAEDAAIRQPAAGQKGVVTE